MPQTWDVAGDQKRPGDVIRFSGDHTLNTPNDHSFLGVGFSGNDNNHSMDYYRAITDNIDAASWQTLLKPTTSTQTISEEVYLGGFRSLTPRTASDPQPSSQPVEKFIVATSADSLTAPVKGSIYNALYGGAGNDTLTGGNSNESLMGGDGKDILKGGVGIDYLFGGSGDDVLIGGGSRDVLKGGLGADTFKFNFITDSGFIAARDSIVDFNRAQGDKIDLSGIDANIAVAGNNAFLNFFIGAVDATFKATSAVYFNTTSHILYGNNDADAEADFSIMLSGITTLSKSDFIA